MALKHILRQLLSCKDKPSETSTKISKMQVVWLCQKVRPIFLRQPMLLELEPPITVCGDIHGQYKDLLHLFEKCKYPPRTSYLFLGDYVDRGPQSIETVCLLFALKISFPNNFFMLRGNHECSYINKQFGFYDECMQYYDVNVWHLFSDVFNCLPAAAIIDDKIFCVHGGISPELTNLDQIRGLERPLEVPEEGLFCYLLWADPDPGVEDWDANERGTSYVFGVQALRDFLTRFDFDLVCRAHQAVTGGFEFAFEQDQGVVTIFSAPNYCDWDNKGAVLHVTDTLYCSFTVMEAVDQAKHEEESRRGTPPRGIPRSLIAGKIVQ
jgi:serine/threonine-protein phosphatase PP1 catalytic subunit